MIELNGFDYQSGYTKVAYRCDKCKEICTELHPKKNAYFFRCRKCLITYVLPKALPRFNYTVGSDYDPSDYDVYD